MKVAVFSTKSYDRDALLQNRGESGLDFQFFESRLREDTVELAAGSGAVCIFVNDSADAPVVEALASRGVQAIALRCAGYNNVDIETARKRGIRVARVPAYSPHAVAEHAASLILTLNRKTHRAFNRVREGNFELKGLVGFDLHGKTVGAVGTGKIGKAFIQIMKGFGCRVLAFDPTPDQELAGDPAVTYTEWDSLLEESDILSLHCPLVPGTHHLFDSEAFSKLKKGAMLINTGRGALIDTKAAIEALKSRQLGYLGLDVYEEENELFFEDRSL